VLSVLIYIATTDQVEEQILVLGYQSDLIPEELGGSD